MAIDKVVLEVTSTPVITVLFTVFFIMMLCWFYSIYFLLKNFAIFVHQLSGKFFNWYFNRRKKS